MQFYAKLADKFKNFVFCYVAGYDSLPLEGYDVKMPQAPVRYSFELVLGAESHLYRSKRIKFGTTPPCHPSSYSDCSPNELEA